MRAVEFNKRNGVLRVYMDGEWHEVVLRKQMKAELVKVYHHILWLYAGAITLAVCVLILSLVLSQAVK